MFFRRKSAKVSPQHVAIKVIPSEAIFTKLFDEKDIKQLSDNFIKQVNEKFIHNECKLTEPEKKQLLRETFSPITNYIRELTIDRQSRISYGKMKLQGLGQVLDLSKQAKKMLRVNWKSKLGENNIALMALAFNDMESEILKTAQQRQNAMAHSYHEHEGKQKAAAIFPTIKTVKIGPKNPQESQKKSRMTGCDVCGAIVCICWCVPQYTLTCGNCCGNSSLACGEECGTKAMQQTRERWNICAPLGSISNFCHGTPEEEIDRHRAPPTQIMPR